MKNGMYLHFRRSCVRMQQRFVELADVDRMPRVFVHGNPHVDNFAKTSQGEAMIDFDRSRLGPYGWDLVRFLSSLALRREERRPGLVAPSVVTSLLDGYCTTFQSPDATTSVPEILAHEQPEPDERSMSAYLRSNTSWAKRMRKSPVFVTHPTVTAMLAHYFRSRKEGDWAARFVVEEAGLAEGSLGMPRMLIVLRPRSEPAEDHVLLDFKQVYQDPDNAHFFNPYVHHGLRMIEASYLHAPGMEQRLGFLTWRDTQYWVRQIPPFKAKIEGNLSDDVQEKLAYAVGAQLGRAHRRSLRETHPGDLVRHLRESVAAYVAIGERMNRELEEEFGAGEEVAAKNTNERDDDASASSEPAPHRLYVAAGSSVSRS
jgi:hypothetical protein